MTRFAVSVMVASSSCSCAIWMSRSSGCGVGSFFGMIKVLYFLKGRALLLKRLY